MIVDDPNCYADKEDAKQLKLNPFVARVFIVEMLQVLQKASKWERDWKWRLQLKLQINPTQRAACRLQHKKHPFWIGHWTAPLVLLGSSVEDFYGLKKWLSSFYPPWQKCDHIVISVCQYKCDPAELLWCRRAIITSSHCCDQLILSVWAQNIVIAMSSLYVFLSILWLLWADVVVIIRR